MLSINTNIASQVSATALSDVSSQMTQTMAQLSTGKNSVDALTADEGFVINLESQEKALGQFVKNAQNGLSLVNVAAATLNQATQMLQQMKVLAEQSANGVNGSTDRAGFQTKFSALNSELNRAATTSTFNGVSLGSASSTISVFVNDTSSLGITISVSDLTTASTGLNTSALDISTSSGASAAITTLNTALTTVATASTGYSAIASRLQYSINSLTATEQNISQSRSTVQDTDYAVATSNLAKEAVLKSAGMAMLVQANQAPQGVLQLLRS